MGKQLYKLSRDDGGLVGTTKATGSVPEKWTESELQHVLLLNPALLGVADHLPLELDGSSTSVTPDQLYVDDVGRFVIVEVKNEPAGLKAMAQLLSYSEHWRAMPLGEIDMGFQTVAARGTSADVLGRSLQELRRWAAAKPPRSARAARTARDPWTVWPEGGSDSVITFARRVWGDHAFTTPGAPARMVLLAPDFDEEAVTLATALSARYVPIELVRASLLRAADGDVWLSWEPVVSSPPSMEPTWAAARRLWRVPTFRDAFTPNAWADHHSKDSFSFSARRSPAVRIWLAADKRDVDLSTAVPDGWYRDKPRRDELRKALLRKLPAGHRGGRWPTWSFKMPAEAAKFDACAASVCDAVCDVLVPATPGA